MTKAAYPKKSKGASSKEANAWFQDVEDLNNNAVTTLSGTSSQIDVSHTANTATLTLSDNLVLPGTEAVSIPDGTTAQRPSSPTGGETRYNTTTGLVEIYSGAEWINIEDTDIASDSQVLNETDVEAYVKPSQLKINPTHAKVLCRYSADSTTVLQASENVLSLTDNGTGDTTVTFDLTFENATDMYVFSVANRDSNSTVDFADTLVASPMLLTTTTVNIVVGDISNLVDAYDAWVVVYGDLA